MDETEHHDGRADHQHNVVPEGVGHCVGICSQQRQQGPVKYRHKHSQNHAGDQSDVKAEGADPLHALPVLLTQQPGDQRTAALAVDVAEGHQGGKDRRTERHAGDEVGVVGPGDEKGI